MKTQNPNSFEAWWTALRKQTQTHLPIESGFSLPVPLRVDPSGYVLAGFFYAVHRGSGPGTGTARPPIARLLAIYPSGQVVQFSHASTGPLFPGLPDAGSLGPLTAGGLTPTERMQRRKSLLKLYPDILIAFLTEQLAVGDEVRISFRDLFFVLAEPGLLPYYRGLNPAFFDWLED